MKVRTCQGKRECYSFTKNTAENNQSEIRSNLDAFKASTLKLPSPGSIVKRSIIIGSSVQDFAIIVATTNLIDFYDAYIQQLIYSIEKVDNMIREYEQQMIPTTSTSTTTVATTTTTKAPNVGSCSSTYPVKNSFNETIKIICYRSVGLTSLNAITGCQSQGMELFGITSIEDLNGVLKFTDILYGAAISQYKIINGIFDTVRNGWFVEYANNKSVKVLSSIAPTSSSNFCMRILTNANGLVLQNVACSTGGTHFCEYGWNTVTPSVVSNQSICNGTIFLLTATNLPIKNVCYVPQSMTPTNARSYCRSNGMEYLAVTNFDEYIGLLSYFKTRWTNTTISFNGAYDSTVNKWLAKYFTKNVDVFPAAVPKVRNNDCLAVSNGQIVTIPCSSSTTFFCEFMVTEAKSYGCRLNANITDSTGKVVKKVCHIQRDYLLADASALCLSNGMSGLFSIRNADEFNSLQTVLSTYQNTSNMKCWIDGTKSANGSWFNSYPDPIPIYSGAIPASGTGTNLVLNFGTNPFGTSVANATAVVSVLCEYDVACRPPSVTINSLTGDLPCGKQTFNLFTVQF